MAIEVTSKLKIRKPFWAKIFLAFCLFLLIAFLLSYTYFWYASKKINKALIKTPQEFALEDEIKTKEKELETAKQKIDKFGQILLEHRKLNNVFNLFENNCLPDVWFYKFTLNVGKANVIVSGIADSFTTIGQQLLALQAEPNLNVNLNNISLRKTGGVDFSLTVNFNQQFFNP